MIGKSIDSRVQDNIMANMGNPARLKQEVSREISDPRITPDMAKLLASRTLDDLLGALTRENQRASQIPPSLKDQADGKLRNKIDMLMGKIPTEQPMGIPSAMPTQMGRVGNSVAAVNQMAMRKAQTPKMPPPQGGIRQPMPQAQPPRGNPPILKNEGGGIVGRLLPNLLSNPDAIIRTLSGPDGERLVSEALNKGLSVQELQQAVEAQFGPEVTSVLDSTISKVTGSNDIEAGAVDPSLLVAPNNGASEGIKTKANEPTPTDFIQKLRSDYMDREEVEQVLGNREPDSKYRDRFSSERRAAFKKLSSEEQAEYIRKLAAEKRKNPPSFPSYARPLDFSGSGRTAENTMGALEKENEGLGALIPKFMREGNKQLLENAERRRANRANSVVEEQLEATKKYLDQPERPLTGTVPPINDAAFEEMLEALQAERNEMATNNAAADEFKKESTKDTKGIPMAGDVPIAQLPANVAKKRQEMLFNPDIGKQAVEDEYAKVIADRQERLQAMPNQRKLAGLLGVANARFGQNPLTAGAMATAKYDTKRAGDIERLLQETEDLGIESKKASSNLDVRLYDIANNAIQSYVDSTDTEQKAINQNSANIVATFSAKAKTLVDQLKIAREDERELIKIIGELRAELENSETDLNVNRQKLAQLAASGEGSTEEAEKLRDKIADDEKKINFKLNSAYKLTGAIDNITDAVRQKQRTVRGLEGQLGSMFGTSTGAGGDTIKFDAQGDPV